MTIKLHEKYIPIKEEIKGIKKERVDFVAKYFQFSRKLEL